MEETYQAGRSVLCLPGATLVVSATCLGGEELVWPWVFQQMSTLLPRSSCGP